MELALCYDSLNYEMAPVFNLKKLYTPPAKYPVIRITVAKRNSDYSIDRVNHPLNTKTRSQLTFVAFCS